MRGPPYLLLCLAALACVPPPPPAPAGGERRGAFDAASGVARTDSGGARAPRVVVQYEVQPDTGGVFMADESDLRRQ